MNKRWRGVLADIERVATAAGRGAVGSYSIEGTRLHERALAAGVELHEAVASERFIASDEPRVRRLLDRLEAADCCLHVVAADVVAGLTDGRGIGEIVGLVRIPRPPQLETLLSDQAGRVPLLLVAVGIEDPGNIGALVRTALAAGAAGFIGISPCDPFHPRAVRTSMGSLFRLPVILGAGIESVLERLRALGVMSVGAVASGGTPLPALSHAGQAVAVLMGSESAGLPEPLRRRVDSLVTIPMGAAIDSYSVNAAAAVILYELRRSG